MEASVTAKFVVECLIEHWRAFGLPGYAQFDNDTIFQGPHAHPDVIGRVSRLCLSLGVVPVFVAAPRARLPGDDRELQRHLAGEGLGPVRARATWTAWSDRSQRYVAALRRHRADRIESAPPRRAFPKRWRLNLQARPRGRIIYLRRTSAAGTVEVLGRGFEVDRHWPNRLVRAEVDLDAGKIRFYRLRRREPGDQPLLKEVVHRIPVQAVP